MRIPRQAPPVRRGLLPRSSPGRPVRAGGSVRSAGTTVLRLSQIANNPSILMDSGEDLIGHDPEIHFDIEPPEAPIEMCDTYCGDNRGTCDGGRKVVHGHIYGDIPGRGGPSAQAAGDDSVSAGAEVPHFSMCDVYCMDSRERVIHGHIYGTDQPHEH